MGESEESHNNNEIQINAAIEQALTQIALMSNEQATKIATAESCTGGWVSKTLTDFPGSSRWFEAGVAVYSNEAKTRLLNVPNALISQHGAVSEAVARAMAAGCLNATQATLAVAITGVAGPSGGTIEKPVGTVWISWQQSGKESEAECFQFSGDRRVIRLKSVQQALIGIVRHMKAAQ